MSNPEQQSQEPSVPLPAESVPAADFGVAKSLPDGTIAPVASHAETSPPWSVLDLAVVLVFSVAAWILLSSLALGVAHLSASKQHVSVQDVASSPVVALATQSATELAVLLFIVTWIGRLSQQGFWDTIHWNWPRAIIARLLIGGIVLALVVDFAARFLPIPKSLPVEKFLSGMAAAYLMSALGIFLAPLVEELFFRGLFYPLARKWAGVTPAVLLTSALFAAIHGAQLGFAVAPLLSIFVVGVVFTLVREKTNSVAASFLVHCGYNSALFATLWVGSDHFRHLEKVANG